MKRFPPGTFELAGLIVCEGPADRQFFSRLLESRQFSKNILVQYPGGSDSQTGEHSGGKGKIGTYLSGSSMAETFIKNVRAVLVVADNDDDPEKAFKEIQNELRKADFPVPTAPGEFAAKGAGGPNVAILMIPPGKEGNLETLCWPTFSKKWKIKKPLDQYIEDAPAKTWGVGKQSKARLQAILAATCEEAPDTSFANHWFLKKEFHLPIDDQDFNEVFDLVKKMEEFL